MRVSIVVIIALAVTLLYLSALVSCLHRKTEVTDLKKVPDTSRIWNDNAGRTHAELKTFIADKEVLQKQFDSVAKILKIKEKQIVALDKASSVIYVHDQLKADTVGGKSWEDASTRLHIDSNDLFTLSGTDTLIKTEYWKRKWFFGAKTYHADFFHTNKHISMVGATSFQVPPSNYKWSFGPSISIGYPVTGIQIAKPIVVVGLSFQYSLFKF